jgi:hypothetical protein
MRILVVGAGESGAKVLRQLQKNPDLTVMTADPRERPHAVEEGVIPQVDVREQLTPLNLDHVIAEAQPDLILLTRTSQDLALGQALGMGLFSESLSNELGSISRVPMLAVGA